MSQPIKAIIFDLDGTLADTLSIVLEAFHATTTPRFGRKLEKQDITQYFGLNEEGILQNLFPDTWQDAFADYLRHYELAHQHCTELFSGLPALLERLKHLGVPLAIVTGKGAPGTLISKRLLGLDRWFDRIETGAAHAPIKPDCIRRILHDWRMAPENTLYVGDSLYDISAAREVGMRIASVGWASTADRHQLLVHNPDQLFDRVDEFSEWCLCNTEI